MKTIVFLTGLVVSSLALAQNDFNVTFRCTSGEIFQVQSAGQQTVVLQRGLYQPVDGPTRLTLEQVISASGAKYSNGEYSVWLKGDEALLLRGEQQIAHGCSASRDSEPLTPIRDASSGIVFIPPERWLAKDVKLSAVVGSDIKQYTKRATYEFTYSLQNAQGERSPLLTFWVFPQGEFARITPASNSIYLGSDGQREYLAQIATTSNFVADSDAAQQFAQLRSSADEVRQAFSMYGVVINQAVETVSVKVNWLDRALRPGSEEVIELYVQENDKLGELVARQRQILDKGNPKPVVLRFDPAAINPKLHYVVLAKLVQNGRVIMKSQPQPVLTQGHGREAKLTLGKK
ncbi:MliC family protein [Chitinibacter sp. SCUT-21]|uniref:YbaY family lipoprotein n=1 Tax=Chitinibacter sp. SCUT-21 TaxID=2970891 RepID=UPI0035A70683